LTIEERKDRVWLEYIICHPKSGGLLACTVGRGHAVAPERAEAHCDAEFSFLGVEVDPCGFRPQPVRMIEVQAEDHKWYGLLADKEWRVLVATPHGITDFIRRVEEANIRVDWFPDGYR